ncbi:UDP-2,3-diacylglucosamine diphosphatase [Wenzhouxiangella sp. AB-CW3]|uniref:UDP-2,3-diacylglucosamine diphosphatase n=1 Tax=Wenzhouxiangella sp. AB-CW3 TaxID=2771012 RepID=UPI001CC316C2|nr:UDP-2,3-diacylglucosamine diphosphatase [Wenzhouxiangella sp. AB-CW3]
MADLHLDPQRPETTRLLVDFLDGPARQARALYILGDLFEAWIGDDGIGAMERDVAAASARLAEQGVEVRFLCGNRDFLVGDDYCQLARMERIEEPWHLNHAGTEVLLMHGDILCTDDVAYQRFRRKARNPDWQRKVLSYPLWLRRTLARLARWRSKRHTGQTGQQIMDVNADAVSECFRHHSGVRRIIHGHTHRRAIHDIEVDQRHCQRIVLGDWHEEGSAIRIDENGIAMLTIARDPDGEIELRLHETAAPLAGNT